MGRNPQKVAIINRHIVDHIGGSEMQCDNIAREMMRRGFDVTYVAVGGHPGKDYGTPYPVLVSSENARSIADTVIQSGAEIAYWRLNKFHFYKAARRIKAAGLLLVFAISHINDTVRFHHYYRANGLVTRAKAIKQMVSNALNFRGYKFVDAVTALNSDFVNIVPVKIQAVVPNCVDTTRVTFSWPRPFIVWVATIKSAKRPVLFYELSKQPALAGLDFLMVGPIIDSGFDWLRETKESNFFYIGARSPHEVNGIIKESLFLVHTCLPEGFGNNFIQAWFCGKPTLTYSFDPQGIIENENIGANAKSDWDAFVQQVDLFAKDAALRESSGARAFAFAVENFSPSRTVDSLVKVFERIYRDRIGLDVVK